MKRETNYIYKCDQELIGELIEHHYDEFSESIMCDLQSGIGRVLVELDRRYCQGNYAAELREEFDVMDEWRRSETAWIQRGK